MTALAPEVAVAIYGRTYLDAEVTVPLATLAERKGKVEAPVTAVLGGFGCNAARVIGPRLAPAPVRLVTVISPLDLRRLRAAVPAQVALDPLLDERDELAWPPLSVIINPAGECRLLRGLADDDEAQWTIDRVSPATLAARLHLIGRVPAAFVAGLLARRAAGARIAWCGGDAVPPELEAELDVMCVNVAEAQRLLGTEERAPRVLAEALARRARPGTARLVTGRAEAPSVVALRVPDGVRCTAGAPPAPLAPSEIKSLKGVGDVFASRFLLAACLDPAGQPRPALELAGALASAGEAATTFLTTGRWA